MDKVLNSNINVSKSPTDFRRTTFYSIALLALKVSAYFPVILKLLHLSQFLLLLLFSPLTMLYLSKTFSRHRNILG